MPAYKKKIAQLPCYCGCQSTHEVFNTYNATLGYYCSFHADEKIKKLDAYWVNLEKWKDSKETNL